MIPVSDISGLYTGSTVEAALDEIGFDGARVSEVYESGFGDVALKADANGNIGIGTITPNVNLAIKTSGSPIPNMSLQDGDITLPDYSGLTINPALDSNEIARLAPVSGGFGGMQFIGLTDNTAGAIATIVNGYLGSNSPTAPAVIVRGAKHNGSTTLTSLASSEIVFQVRNWTSLNIMTMLGNGDVGIGTSPAHTLELGDDDAAKTTTTTWTTTSDRRVKRNIKPFTASTDYIKALPEIKEFEYNGAAGTPRGERGVGFLAQDLAKVAPTLIKYVGKTLRSKGGPGKTQVATFNPHELIFALINTVIELDARLAVLEP
jgi:hypothetical protein